MTVTMALHAYSLRMNGMNSPKKNARIVARHQHHPYSPFVHFLDQVRERIQYKHYSYRTKQQYVYWVRSFVRFHGLRHPREMGAPEVERLLTWLAVEREIAGEGRRLSTPDDRCA
jgi:hypothetical protein